MIHEVADNIVNCIVYSRLDSSAVYDSNLLFTYVLLSIIKEERNGKSSVRLQTKPTMIGCIP
uniref:Putative ovule protein n=1 Tax=Solanum chacoense TaxID=4108 RepID=A0A0V0GUB4_SOLCH